MSNLNLEYNGKQIPIADIEIKSSNEHVTLGNLERNLILKTLGKISVQVGNKYFDLNFDLNGNNAVLSNNIYTIKGESINPSNYPNGSFVYDVVNNGFYLIYNSKVLELAKGDKSKLYLSFVEEQDLNGEESRRLVSNAKILINKLDDIGSFKPIDVYKNQVLFIEDQKQHYILENENNPNVIGSWRPLYLSTNGGVLYNGLTIYNKNKNYTLSLEGLDNEEDNIFNGLRIGTDENYIKTSATTDNSIKVEFNGQTYSIDRNNDTVFEYNKGNIGIGGKASRGDFKNILYGKSKLTGDLFTNHNIMSDDFISRNITDWHGGSGYALKKTSIGTWFLEVDDLVVRNSLSATVLNLKELVVDRTYATGGHMMVTDGSVVTKVEYYPGLKQEDKESLKHPLKETDLNGVLDIGEDYYFLYFNKQDEEVNEDDKKSKFDAGAFCPFIKDDILLCQSFKGLVTKKYYLIVCYSDNYRIAVKYKDFYGSYVIVDADRPSTDFSVDNQIGVDDELVRIGNQDPKRLSRQKVIDINGMKNWITMYDNLNSLTYAKDEEGEIVLDEKGNKVVIDGPLTYNNLKLRIGDLAGLPDLAKGGTEVLPEDIGYGLYADNVYLKGKLVLWRKEDGVEYSEFLGINRGKWNPTDKYYIGDRVTHNGSYYYCSTVPEIGYITGLNPEDYTNNWILLVSRGSDGRPGDSVSYVNITGLSYFKVNTENNPDPLSITLTANLRNIDVDPLLKTIRYQWICNNLIVKDVTYSESFDSHLLDNLDIPYSGSTSNTVESSIKVTDWTTIWENSNYNTFICRVFINGTNVTEDQFTIYKIKDGQTGDKGDDALFFILSNEAISIPASYGGYISPDFIGLNSKSHCSLKVFRGTKELAYSSIVSPDNFNFTISSESISFFQKTDNYFYLIKGHYIDSNSPKLPDGFIVDLNININGIIYNKKVSYSLSKAGQDQNLLDWINDWNGNSTEISADGIISPKIYVGNKISKVDGIYKIEDGIYLGRGLNDGESSALIGYNQNSRTFELTSQGKFYLGKQTSGATDTTNPTYLNGGLTFDGSKLIIGDGTTLGNSDYTLSEYITKTDNYKAEINKIIGDNYITQSELFNLKEIKQRINQEYRDIVTNLINLLGVTEESLTSISNQFNVYSQSFVAFDNALNYYLSAVSSDGFIPIDSNYNLTTTNNNYYGSLISVKLEIENLVKIKFETNTNNVIRSEEIPLKRADGSNLQVGDIWIKTANNNTIELFSEIVVIVNSNGDATWQYLGDKTGTVIDNGLISTGTIKLMDKLSAIDKAGITGSNSVKLYFNPNDLSDTSLVSSTIHTDESFIRIWAGLKEENKTWNDGSFRIYENGALFASAGKIGGWAISESALTSAGNKTILSADGSGQLAAGNIEWDADGNVKFGENVQLNWKSATDRMEFEASNGYSLSAGEYTDITAYLYNGWDDITEKYTSFIWTRDSGVAQEDAAWNIAHKTSEKTLTLSFSDLNTRRVVFSCTATKPGAKAKGSVIVEQKSIGEPGPPGVSTYVWMKYADSAIGDGASNYPTGKKYIGLAYNKLTPIESNNPLDYKWSLIKGEDGGFTQLRYRNSLSLPSTPYGSDPIGWRLSPDDVRSIDSYTGSFQLKDGYYESPYPSSSSVLYTSRISLTTTQNNQIVFIELDLQTGSDLDRVYVSELNKSYVNGAGYMWVGWGTKKVIFPMIIPYYGGNFFEIAYKKNSAINTYGDKVRYRVIEVNRCWLSTAYTHPNTPVAWSTPIEFMNDTDREERIYLLSKRDLTVDMPKSDEFIDEYIGEPPLYDSLKPYIVGNVVRYNISSNLVYKVCVQNCKGKLPTMADYWDDVKWWSDDPRGTSSEYTYEYTCLRTKTNSRWGQYYQYGLFLRYATDGIPGPPGEDGTTLYTWLAYSDYADGRDMYQVPNDNTKYIGIAVNKLTSVESSNPAEYTWSSFKGEDGAPGVDANLLPWVQQWDNNKTLIGSEYVVSPKMFSGTKSTEGKLTGIAQGRDCITIDGVKRTGIFALVDDEVVFELDPMTKKYVFKGDVYADKGVFKGGIRSNANVIAFSNADVNAEGFVDRTIYLNPEDSSDYNVIATYNSSYPSAVCYMYLNGPYADFMGCELNISVTMLAGGSFHDSQFQVKLSTYPSIGRPPVDVNEIYWKGRGISTVKFKHNTFLKLKAVPKYVYDGISGTQLPKRVVWHVVNVGSFKYISETNSLEALGASDPI